MCVEKNRGKPFDPKDFGYEEKVDKLDVFDEFVQNISLMDVDVKNYRIKDFGALRKENSVVSKSL